MTRTAKNATDRDKSLGLVPVNVMKKPIQTLHAEFVRPFGEIPIISVYSSNKRTQVFFWYNLDSDTSHADSEKKCFGN